MRQKLVSVAVNNSTADALVGRQMEREEIEVDKLKNVQSFAIFYWFSALALGDRSLKLN